MSHNEQTITLWLERIFDHEKGFTDDPRDPGNWTGGKLNAGELKGTKYGISASAYPDIDIKDLSLTEAAHIYREDYLKPLHADNYPDGVAFQVLDFAVNSGPKRALKELQQAIGVKPDGWIGPITLGRLMEYSETDLIMLLLSERLDFLTWLNNWPDAGAGWIRRIARNLKYGADDS